MACSRRSPSRRTCDLDGSTSWSCASHFQGASARGKVPLVHRVCPASPRDEGTAKGSRRLNQGTQIVGQRAHRGLTPSRPCRYGVGGGLVFTIK
eukprot:scaffold187477_cov32-Tisochrysis_lutea.AAC.2